MTATLLDISDISIRLWRDGELICDSPSVAHINGANVTFGEQALAKSRSEPQGLYARHWSAIDSTPLVHTTKVARHHADLIYRHLTEIKKQHDLSGDIVVSVPSELVTEQLSLLIGIAQSLELNIVGLVDSSVANVAGGTPRNALIQYVELSQFRSVIATISTNGLASFESAQQIESLGQDYFTNLCLSWVADCFLDQARFDPLQQAQTEQLIFDYLASWLKALNDSPNVNVEIEHLDRRHSVSLSRNALLEVLRPAVAMVTESIDLTCPVLLSHRFSIYPRELFSALVESTELTFSSPYAIFETIGNQLDNIRCEPAEILYTRELEIAPTTPEPTDGA